MTVDRRDEFRDEFWTQGRLLDTPQTRRFTSTERRMSEFEEGRRAFVSLSSRSSSGMGQLVYAYPTAEECRDQVARHNGDLLRGRDRDWRRASQNIPVIGIDVGTEDFTAVLRNYRARVNPRTGDIEWGPEMGVQWVSVDPAGGITATEPPAQSPPAEETPVVLKRRMVLK